MTHPIDARRVSGLLGVLFGLAGMGTSAVGVTLPAIGAEFGLSTGSTSWIISLYALMPAVATAVYGWVADLAGLRLPLVVGVAIMTAGALVGALPGSFELLLAARLMQGVGGGIGSAVVGGFGDVLGIDPSLLLLATLPLVGGLLLLSTIRAAR